MKLAFKICFLILLCAALYWALHVARRIESPSAGSSSSPPPELVPFRTAGGTLHTNGFLKTESITNQTNSWRGTTSASIRFNAILRGMWWWWLPPIVLLVVLFFGLLLLTIGLDEIANPRLRRTA